MKKKRDDEFVVRVAATIHKRLHSRDSADRLVRNAIGLWRECSDDHGKRPSTLILDFNGIEQLSESAAAPLADFRREFSEDKDPEIMFCNLSESVSETLASVEKPLRHSSRKIKTSRKSQNNFLIKI